MTPKKGLAVTWAEAQTIKEMQENKSDVEYMVWSQIKISVKAL